jgi:EmrB/QacA subfamily drug resistance transporter
MGLASGITSVPNVAIILALPTLHREFDASTTMLQWTVTGYLLTYSSLLIAAGRLADLLGRVRVLYAGTVLFMAASTLGALAGSATMLIAAMLLTGVGAAVLTPASLAIVTDQFRGERRGMAVGIWGAATALFSGIGPAIGGAFTSELDWRWILWLNVIVGVAILLGARSTPESRSEPVEPAGGSTPARRPRFDTVGLVCSFGALAGLTLALNESPAEWAWGSPQTIATLVVAGGLLVAFPIVERRVRGPLIDLGMFARRNLTGSALALFVLNFPLGAVLFFLPQFLDNILGFDALKTGMLLLPTSVGMVIAMPLGGRLHDRVGPLPPIVGGMVVTAVAMLLFTRIDESTGYADLWPPLALLGLGVGGVLTPLNLAALGAVPQRQHAAVGAILSTVGGLGGMFGVAASGALFEALQIDRTVDAAREKGVAITSEAAKSLDGLLSNAPSALEALRRFRTGERDDVRESVRDAFLSALGTTMALSLALVVVGAVVALALIRRRPAVD